MMFSLLTITYKCMRVSSYIVLVFSMGMQQTYSVISVKYYQSIRTQNVTSYELIYMRTIQHDVSWYNEEMCLLFQRQLSRDIFQYHYTMWPDHGTPEPLSLALFHNRVFRASCDENRTPMVVHCR